MRRREFLAGATSVGLAQIVPAMAQSEATLKQKAEAKGLVYGCAVGSDKLARDRPFAQLVAREAGILVHEGELKRDVIEPRENKPYNFVPADRVWRFAQENGQRLRGHTLCWYAANPKWLPGALESASQAQKEQLLRDYISKVVGHYKGQMHSWDVVNEAVDPGFWRLNDMRTDSIWYQAFGGEDYIPIAFEAAREADPEPVLFLNDYAVEADVAWNERRRTAVLNLLDRLKAKGVPVGGFGIQGHIHPHKEKFSQDVFADFIRKLEGYDIKLMITEYDVSDNGGPEDPKARDAAAASVTRDFMDVALASTRMLGVLTWGLSDRYSWLSVYPGYKRADGQLSRVLPFDGELVRKPMWDALAAAFEAAPLR